MRLKCEGIKRRHMCVREQWGDDRNSGISNICATLFIPGTDSSSPKLKGFRRGFHFPFRKCYVCHAMAYGTWDNDLNLIYPTHTFLDYKIIIVTKTGKRKPIRKKER